MNVKAKETIHGQTADGKTMIRRGLMVTKSFKAGQVIYQEKPLVAQSNTLSEDYCEHCLKSLANLGPDDAMSCPHCHTTNYCSEQCQQSAWSEHHKFVCPPSSSQLIKHSFDESKSKIALMVLKFVGRVIKEDQDNQNAIVDDSQYSNWDHIERLMFMDLSQSDKKEDEKELDLVLGAFQGKIPQIESFLTLDRYQMLKGKFMYNMIGITSTLLGNNISETPTTDICRTSSPPSSHIGAGLYHITSYISHSCAPNTTIRFVNESSEIQVVAESDLSEGDEILVSWIAAQDKDVRSRRDELHTKFKFRCQCEKCATEA
ncbi:hypothetical protein SeLEV6574_g04972 [Synchytrium endobioticum]|nr:hypothetical protein SeLEV6574_g04972 [Synchytrium endobioticum]